MASNQDNRYPALLRLSCSRVAGSEHSGQAVRGGVETRYIVSVRCREAIPALKWRGGLFLLLFDYFMGGVEVVDEFLQQVVKINMMFFDPV